MRDLATRGLVIRTSPDADLYTIRSMVADATMWIGTETDLAAVLSDEISTICRRHRGGTEEKRMGLLGQIFGRGGDQDDHCNCDDECFCQFEDSCGTCGSVSCPTCNWCGDQACESDHDGCEDC